MANRVFCRRRPDKPNTAESPPIEELADLPSAAEAAGRNRVGVTLVRCKMFWMEAKT
jgi:hypothetical protein